MSTQSLKPGWKMVKFGEVVKNANLVERDPETNSVERIVGLEHIDPENLHIRRWNSVADGTSFTRKFVPGQTLFGKRRAYQRKVAYAEFEGICSGDILTFEPKNRKVLLPGLLPFICQSDAFFDHALDTSAGSLSPRTSWTALKDFEFPLPPLDEQKRIAEILWAADEAVETKSRVVSEFTVSWQKLIDSIVPDPDDSPSRTVVRLDDLCSMQNGRPFPSTAYSEHGFKLLRPGNLAPDGSLSWAEGSTVRLDEKYVQENFGWVVRPGDVVINLTAQSLEDGFMGRVCLAVEGDDSLLNQRLGRFLCNEGVEGEYLYRVLQTSRFRRMVEARCEGSKVRHTYFRHFADLPVVKVSSEEQREIIQAASSIDVARKAAKDSVRDSRALLGRLINGFIENGEAAHV